MTVLRSRARGKSATAWPEALSSCRTFQFDDRKVPVAAKVGNVEFQTDTGLSFDERDWCGRGRGPGPGGANFKARAAVFRPRTVINFVGRLAAQGHMRAMLVVPLDRESEFLLELFLQERQEARSAFRRRFLISPRPAWPWVLVRTGGIFWLSMGEKSTLTRPPVGAPHEFENPVFPGHVDHPDPRACNDRKNS
jgi:hypothetical protein